MQNSFKHISGMDSVLSLIWDICSCNPRELNFIIVLFINYLASHEPQEKDGFGEVRQGSGIEDGIRYEELRLTAEL